MINNMQPSNDISAKNTEEAISLQLGNLCNAKSAEEMRKGLAELVLKIINLLRELMERQAVKQMHRLPLEKQEELGRHLFLLNQQMEEMKKYFGIENLSLEVGLFQDLENILNTSLAQMRHESKMARKDTRISSLQIE